MRPGGRELTEIRRGTGAHRRRVVLYLEGEPWRTTTASVARELALAVGDRIEPDAVVASARSLESVEARERALRLLGYRERSVEDLRCKLLDDGYPAELVTRLVDEFQAADLVNDERFAGILARTLVDARGYGRVRARREFARHGLSDELADRALETTAPADDELERATRLAGRSLRPSDTVERAAARLVRKGFTPSVAFAAARAVTPESGDADAHCP